MTDMPHRRRARRGLRIALVISLALNVLIVGLVVGVVLREVGRQSTPVHQGLRAVGLGPILPALDREDRAALALRIRDDRGRFGEAGRPLAQAVQDFVAALDTEPFDREAAAAALAAQRDHGQALQAAAHGVLLDHLETMSAEARAELAARIGAAVQSTVRRMGSGGDTQPRDGDR